ncbi:hypothetical protein A6A04_14840 [Paramagnetospirillum marisnigri]|uniref:Nudix hydrolase domain-containing protein n=1 Tax=Paramagnetospirillum marisnigri TaxID=1285242 RepID=A0A178MTI3_9PROT|nr:NUDIX hydrolase [Paramagnetospirillum marisnigri]OAN52990.1 hypothetical protein A6A04_14840 [Paramagnetospirillum marisnigri]
MDDNPNSEILIFTRDATVPRSLNGIPFGPWVGRPSAPAAWALVEGQRSDLVEPVMNVPPGKTQSAGVVIVEPDRRVWIVEPSGHFGGYQHTFPKGTREPGLSLQATAIKEGFEESGLRVGLLALLGDYQRDTSVGRYYIARRIGGSPATFGWESMAVKLVPLDRLGEFLNKPVDRTIAADLATFIKENGAACGFS